MKRHTIRGLITIFWICSRILVASLTLWSSSYFGLANTSRSNLCSRRSPTVCFWSKNLKRSLWRRATKINSTENLKVVALILLLNVGPKEGQGMVTKIVKSSSWVWSPSRVISRLLHLMTLRLCLNLKSMVKQVSSIALSEVTKLNRILDNKSSKTMRLSYKNSSIRMEALKMMLANLMVLPLSLGSRGEMEIKITLQLSKRTIKLWKTL
jgi:hypothetical protein